RQYSHSIRGFCESTVGELGLRDDIAQRVPSYDLTGSDERSNDLRYTFQTHIHYRLESTLIHPERNEPLCGDIPVYHEFRIASGTTCVFHPHLVLVGEEKRDAVVTDRFAEHTACGSLAMGPCGVKVLSAFVSPGPWMPHRCHITGSKYSRSTGRQRSVSHDAIVDLETGVFCERAARCGSDRDHHGVGLHSRAVV